MKDFFRHILTGIDGETYDLGRVIGAMGGTAFTGIGVWQAVHGTAPFDFQSFGIGFGAMAGGVGALLKLKENSEPKA